MNRKWCCNRTGHQILDRCDQREPQNEKKENKNICSKKKKKKNKIRRRSRRSSGRRRVYRGHTQNAVWERIACSHEWVHCTSFARRSTSCATSTKSAALMARTSMHFVSEGNWTNDKDDYLMFLLQSRAVCIWLIGFLAAVNAAATIVIVILSKIDEEEDTPREKKRRRRRKN